MSVWNTPCASTAMRIIFHSEELLSDIITMFAYAVGCCCSICNLSLCNGNHGWLFARARHLCLFCLTVLSFAVLIELNHSCYIL